MIIQNGKFNNLKFYKLILKNEVALWSWDWRIYHSYFQMQHFWSGNFLIGYSPESISINVDDVFLDFWTNGCYLLAYSFFQLGCSLRNILVYFFSKGNPRSRIWGVEDAVTELVIQHCKPKSQFLLKSMAQKREALFQSSGLCF